MVTRKYPRVRRIEGAVLYHNICVPTFQSVSRKLCSSKYVADANYKLTIQTDGMSKTCLGLRSFVNWRRTLLQNRFSQCTPDQ
jgi:hypothetical protein